MVPHTTVPHRLQHAAHKSASKKQVAGHLAADRSGHFGQLRSCSAVCSGSTFKAHGPLRGTCGEHGLEAGGGYI
jgi:hypothetical protein